MTGTSVNSEKFYPTPFAEYVEKELWRHDPALVGRGIGLLIIEVKARWRIRRTLRASPAERSQVPAGALLLAIDGYFLEDGDIAELQALIRFGSSPEIVVTIEEHGAVAERIIDPSPLRDLVGNDIGLDGGDYCNTCKRCNTTLNGYILCAQPPPRRCSGRCAVV